MQKHRVFEVSRFALAIALIATCRYSMASCESGQPSVQKEFRDSRIVLIGSVISSKNVTPHDDPDGLDYTIYSLKVERSFKGNPGQLIKVSSVNTSSRFPMDAGKSYLVFLYKDHAGYFVDSCGNSGEEQDTEDAIQEVEHLRTSNASRHK